MTAKRPSPAEDEPVGDDGEPVIRVTFTAEDLLDLLEQIEDWDAPIAHRLRMRYSKHRRRWPV